MYKAKVLWESDAKATNGEAVLTVKEARGYYCYYERPGKDSIGFVLFDKDKELFGLITESKPPMDERLSEKVMLTTAFGGSADMSKTLQEICQIEVEEESGYEVDLDRIISVGHTMVSTQSSQIMEGFLVHITGLEKTKEAEFEKNVDEFIGNEVIWMNINEVFENNDWKSIFIISKAIFEDKIAKK